MDIFQSGFQTKHSTESVLLKVTNDILLSIDSGEKCCFNDAGFDCSFRYFRSCDFNRTLRHYIGIKGVARKWFSSYLQDWTCSVKIGNHVTSS